eukprot:GHRR01027545.1.p1 GENE.GHRR01027545.1~~GHRR01027545.1.p1  ORF type:complete len:129 (+),score=32.19 GHRR01027545.1:533-919(+)
MLLYAGTTLSLAVSAAHQDDFDIAAAFAAHTSPDIRLAAVKLLAAVARGCTLQGSSDPSTHGITQARVDAAFQRLCSVVTTDTVVAIRTEALSGLAGKQQVSLTHAALLSCLRHIAEYRGIWNSPGLM